jgi:hypothetical protein
MIGKRVQNNVATPETSREKAARRAPWIWTMILRLKDRTRRRKQAAECAGRIRYKPAEWWGLPLQLREICLAQDWQARECLWAGDCRWIDGAKMCPPAKRPQGAGDRSR